MTRFFALPLALAAVLLVSACGSAGAEVASAGTDPPAAAAAATVVAAAPAPAPAPAPVTAVEKVQAVGAFVQLKGTQALIIAEEFYQAANRTALAAVRTGLLPDSVLDKIQALNLVATTSLQVGKRASNDGERAAAAAKVMTASLSLRSLAATR